MPSRLAPIDAEIRAYVEAGLQQAARSYRAHSERAAAERATAEKIVSGCEEHPEPNAELEACRRDFLHFLRWWQYKDRESGDVRSFEVLWDGQREMAEAMKAFPQIVLLKAGKLGASELECAYDGYALRFAHQNARVNIFSMDAIGAVAMLEIVAFGMDHLPEWMKLPKMADAPGGDTAKQVKYRAGPDDTRTVRAYAPTKKAAIDATGTHSHVDELARMPWPEDTWASVTSTIAPGGTCHIVSRGAGAANYMAQLWDQAKAGASALVPIFVNWRQRPRYPTKPELVEKVEQGEMDAHAAWYAEQEAAFPTTSQLWYFAPETAEQALAGAREDAFIDIARWDACYDPDLPMLLPGDNSPVVMSLDAGVTNDVFAITLVGRNPKNQKQAALRAYQQWIPSQEGGEVSFRAVENWIRGVCLGQCTRGHPNPVRGKLSDGQLCSIHPGKLAGHDLDSRTVCEAAGIPCPSCENGERIPPFNVVEVCYDRYELRDMTQRLMREAVVGCEPIDQGMARTEADTNLHSTILQREMVHPFNPVTNPKHPVREHLLAAKGKIPAGDDNHVRLEKAGPKAKIDLAVSLSMGTARAMYLAIEQPDWRRAA